MIGDVAPTSAECLLKSSLQGALPPVNFQAKLFLQAIFEDGEKCVEEERKLKR
jgi:hypothetical protein